MRHAYRYCVPALSLLCTLHAPQRHIDPPAGPLQDGHGRFLIARERGGQRSLFDMASWTLK